MPRIDAMDLSTTPNDIGTLAKSNIQRYETILEFSRALNCPEVEAQVLQGNSLNTLSNASLRGLVACSGRDFYVFKRDDELYFAAADTIYAFHFKPEGSHEELVQRVREFCLRGVPESESMLSMLNQFGAGRELTLEVCEDSEANWSGEFVGVVAHAGKHFIAMVDEDNVVSFHDSSHISYAALTNP